MCDYITIAMPRIVDRELIRLALNEMRRTLCEVAIDPRVHRFLSVKEIYFSTQRTACDCGTALGSLGDCIREVMPGAGRAARPGRPMSRPKSRTTSQLPGARASAKTRLVDEQRAEAEGWVELLGKLARLAGDPGAKLLLHSYDGALETERITLIGRASIKVAELSVQSILEMKKDTLYEIRE